MSVTKNHQLWPSDDDDDDGNYCDGDYCDGDNSDHDNDDNQNDDGHLIRFALPQHLQLLLQQGAAEPCGISAGGSLFSYFSHSSI